MLFNTGATVILIFYILRYFYMCYREMISSRLGSVKVNATLLGVELMGQGSVCHCFYNSVDPI